MDPSDPHTLRRDLSAFADGELRPAASRALLQRMLVDPALADDLRRVVLLTQTAGAAVRRQTPPPSPALQARLRQLAAPPPEPTPLATAPSPGRSTIAPMWFPRALAAAALLAVGTWAGLRLARPVVTPRPRAVAADVLPAAVVSQAEEIHGVCSRLALGLHSAGYPADIAALAASVESDLHSDRPYPDLSAIGFRYRGAGPCGKGLPDTAHLLYRSVRPGSVNAVSVFVQPWHDQYALAPGRLYTVSVAQNPFPMLAWRTDHVVYFLVADNAATDRAAVALIRGAPTTGP
jgi:anti-sigma factor RsiW